MGKNLILALVAATMLLAGCATKSSLNMAQGAAPVPAGAAFTVNNSVDASHYAFEDSQEKFSLVDAMTSALKDSMDKAQLTKADAPYSVTTTIKEYAPGNAFSRWLLPGAGATKLSVECVVSTRDGLEVARIPVERTISAGGGYTIGAWKKVFLEVADEITNVIQAKLLGGAVGQTPKG